MAFQFLGGVFPGSARLHGLGVLPDYTIIHQNLHTPAEDRHRLGPAAVAGINLDYKPVQPRRLVKIQRHWHGEQVNLIDGGRRPLVVARGLGFYRGAAERQRQAEHC